LFVWLVVLPRVWVTHEGLQALRADAPWYWLNLINVDIARAGWPTFVALGHFWSLAVEEHFYIVWPFVILLFSRHALIRICVGSVAGALLLRVALSWNGLELPAYVLMPVRMDAFAVGSLISLVARGPNGLASISRAAAIGLPIATAGLIPIYVRAGGLYNEDVLTLTAGLSLLALAFGSLLVLTVAAPSGAISRALSAPSLRLLGRYSYAIYVFHHPMLFFLPAALTVANLPMIAGSYLPAVLFFSIGAGALSVALGIASWHLCEKHFLRLKTLFPSNPTDAIGRGRNSYGTKEIVRAEDLRDLPVHLSYPPRPVRILPDQQPASRIR
jgi:peptidoglycan/LPS O-acetylase OafA/YrhL